MYFNECLMYQNCIELQFLTNIFNLNYLQSQLIYQVKYNTKNIGILCFKQLLLSSKINNAFWVTKSNYTK